MVGVVGTTLWIVPLILAALSYLRYDAHDPETPIKEVRQPLDRYDFIVVGGGSAGAVVAGRLSEVPEWKILLLEAGPDENEITDVPSLAAYLQLSKRDWTYKTEATGRACLGMWGGRCNWPRGRVLGGSSVLNYMLYVRGNRRDYDRWEELGNPGWGYRDVLPYFLKSEDNRNPYLARTPYHRAGGPLTVGESPWRTPLVLAFLEAGKELGHQIRDINGEEQAGFMIAQGTIRRGTRCSTAKAFLRPVKLRKNIHIALNAQVTRILINPTDMRAFGVEYVRNGRKHHVTASRETILSAGAINTPQLLMLSGIGPPMALRRLGVPTLRPLEGVGENLQDHVALGGLTFVVTAPVAIVQRRIEAAAATLRYVANGEGPMTTLGGVEGLAFVATKYGNLSYPDIQFHFAPASISSDGGARVRKVLGLTDQLYDTVYAPIANKDVYTLMPLLLRPKSRGRVWLKDNNPFSPPIIDANYFEVEEDVKRLAEGAKIALNLSRTAAFRRFGSHLHTIPLPTCHSSSRPRRPGSAPSGDGPTPFAAPFGTDAYWECHARTISMTVYHPVGTAKMGPEGDPGAVVDSRLRVHGVRGLRVVDASIMPEIVSGNTNAPVVMIGEKGADMIKEDWGKVVVAQ